MKLVLACFLILTTAASGQATPRHILVRDFRTVKDGQVVSFNIGTAAHGPATVAVLKKHLPGTKVSVWADAPLAPELKRLMDRRFPDVEILTGLEVPKTDAELFLVSSGSSIAGSVQRSIGPWRKETGRPVAAYAIGFGPRLKPLTESFAFCFFRDRAALAKAEELKAVPAVSGFAPDAVFDFDAADDAGAAAFLKALPWNYDSTKVTEAEIGRHLTVVRGKDGAFYAAGLTGVDAHETSLKLDFLADGVDYTLDLLTDDLASAAVPRPYRHARRTVRKGDVVDVKMAASGGFCATLLPVR